MTGGKTAERTDKPAVETDSYRIWDGRYIPAKERRKLKRICLEVHPGERVNEVLSLDLGRRGTVKILSKERIKDGRINCLVKLEKPGASAACCGWTNG